MKLAFACAVLAATTFRVADADACSCARRRVWSVIDKAVPTNAHVMLWVDDRGFATTFLLREATGKKPEVPTTRVELRSASTRVVELVPERALRPRARYEVVDNDGNVVLSLTTSSKKDIRAPTWTSLTAEYVQQPGACCMCHTGRPFIRVSSTGLSDDGGTSQVVFGVWTTEVADPADIPAIDYDKPPLIYLRGWKDGFDLGNPSICSRDNFALATGKLVKIGVRPIDLAGNAGDPRETLVDLGAKPNAIPD